MSTNVTMTPSTDRRFDLDWVRIIAFGLLIFYHVACFYWPGTPHNQALSPRGVPWLIVPMLALNPWRLTILFIVSGAATRFMADKMTSPALLKLRATRLLIPLVFVSAVIVPAMGFVAVRQWAGFNGDFVSYLPTYFSHVGATGINYGHLWFVAYLFDYTALLIGLLAVAPKVLPLFQRTLESLLRGWGLIVWPALYLAMARALLSGPFPQTMDLVHDWYSHAIFLPAFLLGFALVKSERVWEEFARARGWLLVGALGAYAAVIAGAIAVLGQDFNWSAKAATAASQSAGLSPLTALGGLIYGLDQWLWIAAAFGFARRHLSRSDGPVRRYLTEAIFPFYIIHELTIMVGGYYLAKLGLNLGLEAALLIAGTALSCVLTYEIARRIGWLRPVFGLRSLPKAPARLPPTPKVDLFWSLGER
jgi:glucan biosynthesis protein C